jgi:hypothetical protein
MEVNTAPQGSNAQYAAGTRRARLEQLRVLPSRAVAADRLLPHVFCSRHGRCPAWRTARLRACGGLETAWL